MVVKGPDEDAVEVGPCTAGGGLWRRVLPPPARFSRPGGARRQCWGRLRANSSQWQSFLTPRPLLHPLYRLPVAGACSSMLRHSSLKCSSRLYIPFRQVRNNASSTQPVINIPRSSIYELGQQHPTLRDLSFTVKRTDSWAVVSKDAATVKTALIGALTGTHRLEPHPPGGIPAFEHVRVVRFAHRGKASGDGFYDFTARYGAVREEDRRTLRDTFFPEFAKPLHALAMPDLVEAEMAQRAAEVDQVERESKRVRFEFLADRLRLVDLLDLPMVALSNGQTRRARIAKALLEDPKLLILDEPLSESDTLYCTLVCLVFSSKWKPLLRANAIHFIRTPHPGHATQRSKPIELAAN